MIEDRKILLVEGTDDEHVMKHLFGTRIGRHIDEISAQQGIEKLIANLPVHFKRKGIGTIGIIVDADTDLVSRWRMITNALIRRGYEHVPESPVPMGTIVERPSGSLLPRAGIWLMPDNQTTGILENFLQSFLPRESTLVEYVKQCVANIPDKKFRSSDESKALIHTWLAWQENPGLPFGSAITAGFLNPMCPQADSFIVWLRNLFFPGDFSGD